MQRTRPSRSWLSRSRCRETSTSPIRSQIGWRYCASSAPRCRTSRRCSPTSAVAGPRSRPAPPTSSRTSARLRPSSDASRRVSATARLFRATNAVRSAYLRRGNGIADETESVAFAVGVATARKAAPVPTAQSGYLSHSASLLSRSQRRRSLISPFPERSRQAFPCRASLGTSSRLTAE